MARTKQPNDGLSARIERAAHLYYLNGATETEIAAAVGIRPVTVRDWKRTPDWRTAIGSLRAEQRAIASNQMTILTTDAVKAFRDCLGSDHEPTKLRAATWILERGAHLAEFGFLHL